jgi:pyruvate/2-oxoglutarate dehydrogenase complex dihydrolipoamide dehydrogenase (E3) component
VSEPWDLLVVGGGTAGLVGAYTGAALGARVALVERQRTGGDCLWTGCVPSKTLLAAASRAAQVRDLPSFISSGEVRVDFAGVMADIQRAIHAIEPVDSPDALREAGVVVMTGHLTFTGPREAVVAGEVQQFHQALLATGAGPRVPDLPGVAAAQPLTSETVWGLPGLPERMTIVGGGPVGCELGQAFARLGTHVTLVESGPRLLPHVDPDASHLVQRALERDGVLVLTGHRAIEVIPHAAPGSGEVVLAQAGQRRTVEPGVLLLAVGREPRTAGMGLEQAGVRLTRSGSVAVTRILRTSNSRIWAAGDVTPFEHLTHLAAYHAGIAAGNALLGLRRRAGTTPVPRVVYTDPEVAAVGAPTWSDAPSRPPRTVTRGHDHVDRAITDGRVDGFSRLALNATGTRVIGATVVSPRAGESIAGLTVAVGERMSLARLAATIHPYPTYGDGPWNAAVDDVRRRLAQPAAQAATRAVVSARRAWLGLRCR